jgi:hypothetical protein
MGLVNMVYGLMGDILMILLCYMGLDKMFFTIIYKYP